METRVAAPDTPVVDEAVRGPASAPLRPHVAWYTGYRQAGMPAATHRGLPSPFMTLIFTLDDPLDIAAHADPAQPADSYEALLGGLHSRPALITHPGRQSGVQVAVDPLAARALFGVPAGELAHIDLHVGEVLGRMDERVLEKMRVAEGWRGRFAAIDEALCAQLAATADAPRVAAHVPPEVARAWRLLLDSGGAITVAALADEVGWSTRHLSTRFQTEIGLSPKAAGRVIRFGRARREIARTASDTGAGAAGSAVTASGLVRTRLTLAEIAVRHGYFDQAHLDREFRELAGCSPTRWLAEEGSGIAAGHSASGPVEELFRNVQADSGRSGRE